jgi:hypothetical protein
MKTNTVNFNTPVSIQEAWRIIPLIGAYQTVLLQGEPGIAKSATFYEVSKQLPGHDAVFIDGATVDMGEMFMRAPNRDNKTLDFYPSSLIKPESNRPKFVFIDESNKCDKFMQRIFTRLALDRYWGDYKLPDGSIVVMTSNLSSDGVGDGMLAHMGNRITILNIRKPSVNEWLAWATGADIAAEVKAWVHMNPRCMASYLDGGQEENPYIFQPGNKVLSFVTPRSLHKSSYTVRHAKELGPALTKAALAGTIGMAAAESMSAFISLANEISTSKQVFSAPDTTPIPEKPAALFMMLFNAIDAITTQDELSAFMRWLDRSPSLEAQAVFFTMALKSNKTSKLASTNARITEWARTNYELMI